MDVTEQILKQNLIYGSSDNTDPKYLAASKSLNYAAPLSITKPLEINSTVVPFTFNFQDVVGVFGSENAFV